jgi:homoserine kinase
LAPRSLLRAYARLADPTGKHFRLVNRIPLERGLGSSASAIALGLAAAAPQASAEELLAIGLEFEGHADNLAPALVGGVTLTWEKRIARIGDTVPLAPVAVIPAMRVRTALSRHALPDVVPLADAAVSAGRAALLGAALAAQHVEWFTAALTDRIHEPYRPSKILEAIRDDLPPGARGATLSGSGPSVMVWTADSAATAADLRERFPKHEVLPLSVAGHGAVG